MTDLASTEKTMKKKKLPPITSKTGDEDEKKKPTRKKKKTTSDDAGGSVDKSEAGDGAPTRRRRLKTDEHSEQEPAEGENTSPRRVKRKRKPKAETEDGDPASARSQREDDKEETPRKKVRKKKVKKTPRTDDELLDSTLVAALGGIEEDIVTEADRKDVEEDEEQIKAPYSTASNVMKSQPVEKLYIETGTGFKGENKARLTRRIAEEHAIQEHEPEAPKRTTIEFALGTYRFLKTICLFVHGLTAGVAMWHTIMVYVLLYHSYTDFLDHYYQLALPVQCMFYIMFVLCLVSTCDRFDVGNPNRRFVLRAFTLQSGAVSILLYLIAIVLSLVNANLEDRMGLYKTYPELWENTQDTEDNVILWRNLSIARAVAAIMAWLVLSIDPNTDRLIENLGTREDDILGTSADMTGLSPA